ncbi:MAG TPA: AAA family ATPase [Candidatus Limnocylindrales bacterium]|nr:AAA family ATPase [Candidatus Limnocylindrales bacterium]
MRIRRLQVRDLRRYRELDIDLAPGVTVVRGPNEAGKSTIQRAIELALTRRVTSNAGDLEALRPWDAAADARPWVALEFEQEEEDGRIATGTVEKWFAGQKGTVDLVYDGQRVTDPALADQVLAELSGIPNEPFFRSTASVRHHELSDVARDEAALRDRLQASISGADRGTGRAKKKLERAIYELTTKGDKNPGRLKVAEAAVAQTAATVEKGELDLAQLERDRDTLSSARERRAETERTLAERRAMLEKARQAERLEAERASARERYERFREAVEVSTELDELAQTHPSPNPLPVIRQAVDRLRVIDTRMRELRAALAGEIDVSFEVAPEPTWRPLSRWGLLAVVVGLLIGGGGFVLDTLGIVDLGMPPLYVGAAIALIGGILSAVALWVRRSSQMQEQLRGDEIDRRLRGRSEMEAELRQAEADSEQQLGTLGLDDLAAAEDLLAREEAHVARMDQMTAQLDGLVGKEPREALPTLRDGAALEIEQKTSALDALGPIAKEPRARERLEVEVRDSEAGLDRARDDEANARARVENNRVDAEEVAAEAERLAMWREQLAVLQRRHRVLDATLRAIERAESATMKTATRYLEGHMVRDVSTVTGGRYRRVRVDDKSLDIDVHAPERGDWVPVSALSQGTLDLVYLTARLGLVRLVTGDRRPPLVLDDPFVTLDDERATRALALLKRVADDFQIIYLTTSDRYDGAAHAVVELPGPATIDDGVADPSLSPAEAASGAMA